MTDLKAPDGNLIEGIVQKTGLIAGLHWPAVTGLASGDDLNFGQYAVFEDVDGGRWLYHHLIPVDQPPWDSTTLKAMEHEVAWRMRARLLYELADTFLVDSTGYRYWQDMADEWENTAENIRKAFAWGEAAPAKDPIRPDDWLVGDDPEQWPGSDVTTAFPPCESLAQPWSVSQHRKDLMLVAAEAMLLEQTVDNVRVFHQAETKMVLERVAKLFCTITLALQKEAIARDLAQGDGTC